MSAKAVASAPVSESGKSRLRAWRDRRGLTQDEMARATGLSASVYWRLENGRIDNPPYRHLNNCALALGCEVDDLIEPDWREWFVFDQQRAAAAPEPSSFWRNSE